MKLAEISIKRPSLIIALFTILTLADCSVTVLQLIPKFETNVIHDCYTDPGASPSEIENTVTKKN
jgi:HAE1 family hydrophobic/amphiphilic exporter-1